MFYCTKSQNINIKNTIEVLQKKLLDENDYKSPITLCEALYDKLKAVHSLDLSDENLVDLRPLSGLDNLEMLILSNNKITNLWHLFNLPTLRILILNNNMIKDIGALSFFDELTVLNLDNNNVTNILPIKDCLKLEQVSIEGNPVLTEVSYEQASETLDLIDSIIWFRHSYTINDYAPLNLGDIEETALLLNNRANRGDLIYFRALRKDRHKENLFENTDLWAFLDIKTKKIMTAVYISEDLTDFFVNRVFDWARQKISAKDLSLLSEMEKIILLEMYQYVEQVRGKIHRVIEYFMMDNIKRPPFSIADNRLMEDILSKYANGIKNSLEQGMHPLAALKSFLAPERLSVALKQAIKIYTASMSFNIRSGI